MLVNTRRTSTRGAGAGVDEGARIDVAFGEQAGKGRHHLLESLQLLQPAHVGVGRGQAGLGLLVAAGLLIGFLGRNRTALEQVLPAFRADLGQFHLGRDLLAGGPGLGQLLVDLGRVDLGQEFSGLHVAADVVGPAHQVAAGAGVDRRILERQQRSGQHQVLVGILPDRTDHGHAGHRVGEGGPGQGMGMQHLAGDGDAAGQQQRQQRGPDQEQGPARRRRRQRGRPLDPRQVVLGLGLDGRDLQVPLHLVAHDRLSAGLMGWHLVVFTHDRPQFPEKFNALSSRCAWFPGGYGRW
jgi:hypothetical protein